MKKRIVLLIAVATLFSCSNNEKKENQATNTQFKTTEPIEQHLKNIEGYFTKNDVVFEDEWKNVVVSNQKDFDTYFGIAKTMINKIEKIYFNENTVVAIITKPSRVSKEIIFLYSELNEGELFILYNIKDGTENSYESTDLFLAKIPKNIRSVRFKTRYTTETLNVR